MKLGDTEMDTVPCCQVILFTDDLFWPGYLLINMLYTHCSQLCAEVQNIIRKECCIVSCRVGQVILKHLHHVPDVAVVLSQFCLESCRVQQVAFTDAGRDLINLYTQIFLVICVTAFGKNFSKLCGKIREYGQWMRQEW